MGAGLWIRQGWEGYGTEKGRPVKDYLKGFLGQVRAGARGAGRGSERHASIWRSEGGTTPDKPLAAPIPPERR